MGLFTTSIRVWLAFLAVFELPMVVKHGLGAPLKGGFGSNLPTSASTSRLWAFMLVLLVLPRITAAVAYDNAAVRWQCAVVHVAEAAYFSIEHAAKPTKADPVIVRGSCCFHMSNALVLCYCVRPMTDLAQHARSLASYTPTRSCSAAGPYLWWTNLHNSSRARRVGERRRETEHGHS